MNVVVAIDSFKGSMPSLDAGCAAAAGWKRVFPDADIDVMAVADGGEGTLSALVGGCGGTLHAVTVCDPLSRPIRGEYGILADGTAVIEMASAAGLPLLASDERDPLKTTTYGVGEMIADALARGCRSFIVGIGGSATNDGGAGMLQALGFELLDKNGDPIARGAVGLKELAHIRTDNAHPALSVCTFRVACDVTNPLCGKDGCSAVFSPQKGATPEAVAQMDAWLSHYADIVKATVPTADQNAAGAGAAGGMGFALKTFLGATLTGGIDLVLQKLPLAARIKNADLVITGEGRLDRQTVMGKTPIGVAAVAKQFRKPVIAFAGGVTADATVCHEHGIDAFFPIVRGVCTLDEAMHPETAKANMTAAAEQAARLWNIR